MKSRARNRELKSKRLVFFGDSICVGQGVSIHMGWVTRIAILVSQLVGEKVIVVNSSENGRTSRQALERMPYEIQTQGVNILIVQFGLNDCNYWESDGGLPRVSEKGFEANLEEILLRAKNFGAKSIILNTNHPTMRDQHCFKNTRITLEQSNRRYNEIIRRVARNQTKGVVLNDVEKAFRDLIKNEPTTIADLLLDDGLHLSAHGHDIYYDLTAPIIERQLKELL